MRALCSVRIFWTFSMHALCILLLFLSPGTLVLILQGLLYTITDVIELHEWMVSYLAASPLFERVGDAEMVRVYMFLLPVLWATCVCLTIAN